MSHANIADLVDGDLHAGLREYSPRGEYTVGQAGFLARLEALAEPLTSPTIVSEGESTPIGDSVASQGLHVQHETPRPAPKRRFWGWFW